MSALRRSTPVVAAVALIVATPGIARAPHEPPPPWPQHQRLYLLSAPTDYLHWSVDPRDPELDESVVERDCGATRTQGVPGHSKPCLTGGLGAQRFHTLYFAHASLFETPPSWSASAPLRFHLSLEVEAVTAYTVSLVLQSGTGTSESQPAAEVAPGVWEGELGTGGPLGVATMDYFGVRVRSESPAVTLRLRVGGASWIELPQPVGAKGVPDLIGDSSYRPTPTSFASATRSFTFNDDAWSAWSFTGDLGEVRTFDLPLEEDAVAIVAWVEAYESPFLHDVRRGRPADARKFTDGAAVRLLRDGEEVAHGAGPYAGQGTGALATTGVAAGPLTLEVNGYTEGDDPFPFTAHLVATHGERTLDSMRWRVPGDYSFRVPSVAACPAGIEPVPVTDEVTTFHVDVDWDSEAPGLPSFNLRYNIPDVGLFPCSEEGTGDNVRFTIPGNRIWYFGATPAYDAAYVSAFDTVFDFEVRYTYTPPPPPPHEEDQG